MGFNQSRQGKLILALRTAVENGEGVIDKQKIFTYWLIRCFRNVFAFLALVDYGSDN